MAEHTDDIGRIATSFAEVSSKAVAASNVSRLQMAQGNIQAAKSQIDLDERTSRRQIARSLAQFQGQQAAGRAFRGGGELGSGFAIGDAATAQAADSAAIVEANAAAREAAAVAANQVQLDDPILAAIEGGIQGMNLGTQIASALMQEAELKQKQSSQAIGSALGTFGIGNTPQQFQNTVTSFLDVPGLDVNSFLSGIDFGVD